MDDGVMGVVYWSSNQVICLFFNLELKLGIYFRF